MGRPIRWRLKAKVLSAKTWHAPFSLRFSGTCPLLLQCLSTVFPDNTVSAELAINLRVRADHRTCQTLLAVAVFILFTIKHGLLFWMIAAVIFINHSGSNLAKKPFGVKQRAHCVRRMVRSSIASRQRELYAPCRAQKQRHSARPGQQNSI